MVLISKNTFQTKQKHIHNEIEKKMLQLKIIFFEKIILTIYHDG